MRSFSKIKVLVVDDMEYIRASTIKILKELGFSNANIYDYSDAISALSFLSKEARQKETVVDLVLCDWNMPEMNGIELLREFRKIEQFKSVPFILITTERDRDKVVQAAQAGVSGFIIKPVNSSLLLEKILTLFPTP